MNRTSHEASLIRLDMRYASDNLKQFTSPKTVDKTVHSDDDKAMAALLGALGAIEKGGRAIGSDDSEAQQAGHYWRVLSGREDQELSDKDFEKISELVSKFLAGPV